MKKLLLLLLLITSCKKEDTIVNNDPAPGEIVIRPDGPIGSQYQYRVFCAYAPEDYFRFDSSIVPTFYIQGRITEPGQLIRIPMTRSEFYYVVGYRNPEIFYTDSFYYHNANGSGYAFITSAIYWEKFNRTNTKSITLPASIY